MKKIYSIGYVDTYGSFQKEWERGCTRKFATIEEAEDYIKKYEMNKKFTNIRIMQGWKVIKEVK